MNDLGGVFQYGVGVPKNSATALEWYEKAAEFSHAGAMIHMGHLSEEGLEIPQDFANARHWYEKAAALGNAASMNNLADLYRYGRGVGPQPLQRRLPCWSTVGAPTAGSCVASSCSNVAFPV
jgi:uncharacterized protein